MNLRRILAGMALSAVLVGTIGTSSVFAGPGTTVYWNYSNYDNGSYVPKSGRMESYFGSDRYFSTTVFFQFDTTNVNSILDYNNGGDNPGASCDNVNAYVGLDVTSVADSQIEAVNAYSISTNLPDPKTDLENDNPEVDTFNEESEVVALGRVEAGVNYSMATYWNDYRNGDSGDSSTIQAQFNMSNKPWWSADYNNCYTAGSVQASLRLGDYPNQQ